MSIVLVESVLSLLLAAADGTAAQSSQPRTLTSAGAIRALGFTPDGRELVSGYDGGLRAWNLQTGESRPLPAPRDWIRDLVVLRDGRILAGGDKGAYVLSPSDGKRQQLTRKAACSVDLSKDGKTAVLVAEDGFHVYSLPGFQPLRTIPDEARFRNCRHVAVSRDGKHVAGLAHQPDFQVRLWEVSTGRAVSVGGVGRERGKLGDVVAFAPDRSLLAATRNDNEIGLVDYATGTLVGKLVAHRKPITELAFSPDGRTLAAASEDGIRLWDLTTQRTRAKLMPGDYVTALTFSPDGQTLGAALLSDAIKLWQLQHAASPKPTASTAAKPSGGEPAYMVIADGASDFTLAEAKLVAYDKQGFPRYGSYPKLVDSSTIQGLKPGYWVVVAAVARDKSVAQRLNGFLGSLGAKSYLRKVEVDKADDLRLLVIRGSQLRCERTGKRTITGRVRAFYLLLEEECHGECEGQGGTPFITSRAGKNGGVALPYTADQVPKDGVLHIGCEHDPAGFGESRVACTLPGVLDNDGPRFDAKDDPITEIDTVTAGCYDYDELNDYLHRNVYHDRE